ncbi:hypothetical protein [Micromonospora auratinigra]|uniref:Uncharacterized protein n=1 Tax=Micromonospora auratinigra TaxID=261654 RepID=A0A1A8ZUH6_9ACTN|nr:hypothetical protein [Micromonospora auratinigra]SBT47772.1 hypothetical protein GA0070611_3836 [Micromonospora auratinigra]
MVYRYESDEDAFLPKPGSDPSVSGPAVAPPAGPSPSRFPTPSLPPPARSTRPAIDVAPEPAEPPVTTAAPAPAPARPLADPAVPRPTVPVPQPSTSPLPRAAQAAPTFRTTEPLDLSRTRQADRRRGGRTWQALIGGTAVLVLLALAGLAVAALLKDRDRTGTPQAATTSSQPVVEQSAPPAGSELDSRDTDQLALTAKEVFPGKQLVVTDGRPAYEVLKASSSASCPVAATGEIADLLVRLGCNQVVRATLRAPDGDHLLTAGLFNLTDVASAQRARDRIRQLLDERQGRFRGMAAGDDTDSVERAAARVGWQVRGHYIAYCLVTRTDGERISATDAKAREILYDMIELYLNRGVLERRANGGVATQPTAPATDGVTNQDEPTN